MLPSGKLLLEKPHYYYFKSINFLGNFITFILPNTYLSYLNLLGRWVGCGNLSVSTKTPINTIFGNLGRFFCKKLFRNIFLSIPFTFLLSCQNSYQLSKQDRLDYNTYPEHILIRSGKLELVKARRIEIIDSLQQDLKEDLAKEFLEEQANLLQDY